MLLLQFIVCFCYRRFGSQTFLQIHIHHHSCSPSGRAAFHEKEKLGALTLEASNVQSHRTTISCSCAAEHHYKLGRNLQQKVSVNLQLNTIRPCYREKYLQLRKCTETASSDALKLQLTLRKLLFNPKVIFVFSWCNCLSLSSVAFWRCSF